MLKFYYRKTEQQGYSYLWFLFILVFISIFFSNNLIVYSTIKKKNNEEELFRIATMYCKALNEYYTNSPTGIMVYPDAFVNLLRDPRYTKDVRYLRTLFLDPITNKEFIYIRNNQQEIVGFHSVSENKILRKSIPKEFYYLSSAEKYSDLRFCLF